MSNNPIDFFPGSVELQHASQRSSGSHTHTSVSDVPSEAASHTGIAVPSFQPATRPELYPFEVLWNAEDCKYDPDVKLSYSNPSRPSMEKAVRHADGTLISPGEWSAIRATARLVRLDLINLPPPRYLKDRRGKNQLSHTKTFFRTYFPKEWQNALGKMENQQPLLALCSAHWKADHVLGNALLTGAKASHEANDSEEEHGDVEIALDTRLAGGSKRPKSPQSPHKRKKTKSGNEGGEGIKIDGSHCISH